MDDDDACKAQGVMSLAKASVVIAKQIKALIRARYIVQVAVRRETGSSQSSRQSWLLQIWWKFGVASIFWPITYI